jgi:hypothetical protein
MNALPVLGGEHIRFQFLGATGLALTAEQRRVLEMLAESPNGCTQATLRAHDFGVGLLAGLVRDRPKQRN